MTLGLVDSAGSMGVLIFDFVRWLPRRPWRWRNLLRQVEVVGVNSTFVVLLTGLFTGMVLALQSYNGFARFGAESLVGTVVALSVLRELGPVLSGLMVTARAGSLMAAELGTMRVTEQIDALYTMAVNPIHYLIVPRVVAAVLVVPMLVVLSDFIGILGGYLVGVKLLGINSTLYINKTVQFVELDDMINGLIKSAVFGLVLAVVSCHFGFRARGGAAGVGKATTQAVVYSSVLILVFDYILTSLLFGS
jgi:phospholipid/cholesterol/gamma-HCH transport system permease protein